MIKLPSLPQVQQQLLSTLKRFPLPAVCATGMTLLGLYLIHDKGGFDAWIPQVMLTLMLGALFLTALTLVAETMDKTRRGLLMLGGVCLLVFYWWTLPNEENLNNSLWIFRHIFLCLGSLVALAWAPFWQQDTNNKIMWRWCSDLLGNLLVTMFFAMVLFLGVAAAFWSISALFSLDIPEELYGDVWVLVAVLFSPLFFLAQIEPNPQKLKEPKTVSAFMSIFAKYIMTPLAVGYLLILYTYTAKILITWEWPKNVLAWLVIAFLGVAIFTYFLWTPLIKAQWQKYRRIFWLLMLPQILLLFIVIGWRIQAYGWTENRYFVVVLGCWLLGTALYFLVNAKALFKYIFMALVALIFISQVGPLSGYEIGKKSQSNRLQTILSEAKILQPGGTIVPTKIEVNRDTRAEVSSILDYLNNRHGLESIEPLMPEIVTPLKNDESYRYNRVSEIMEALGLEYISKWERSSEYANTEYDNFSYSLQYNVPRNTTGYGWRVFAQYNGGTEDTKTENLPYNFRRNKSGEPLGITVWEGSTKIDTINLEAPLKDIQARFGNERKNNLDPEVMKYEYESDRFDALIYFTNIWGNKGEVKSFDPEMYVRIKE